MAYIPISLAYMYPCLSIQYFGLHIHSCGLFFHYFGIGSIMLGTLEIQVVGPRTPKPQQDHLLGGPGYLYLGYKPT